MISFEVGSPAFQKEIVKANIPAAGKGYVMSHLLLNPSQIYPFGGDVTTVTGKITRKKLPCANQHFYIIPSHGGEVMKVAEDKAEAGNNHLKLFAAVPEAQLTFPGKYLIKDKDEAKREVCLITQGGVKDGMYPLEKGLKFSHLRATALVEVIEYTTSDDGSFFFALPDLKNGRVSLDFIIKAEDGKSLVKTIGIEGNQRNILTDLEI
ncbi:MAG: hypothetical protein PHU78_05585 [Heliobacteriaceae bacterium]|nr:hypothetical protein [Heliobacteriaceae bacterium]